MCDKCNKRSGSNFMNQKTGMPWLREYLAPVLSGLLITVIFSGCASMQGGGKTAQEKEDAEFTKPGMLMIFSEREAGSPKSFRTSMFVNKDYLYLADSRSRNDFVLLDRAKKIIYSLTNDDKTILVIDSHPVTIKPPIEIKYVEESQPSAAIPMVQGKQAHHYRYFANGKRCYDSVTFDPDFMPDVADAMREFRTILAGEHAKSVGRIPTDMYDACDLAVNVFYPTRHIAHGIPLREWDQNGYQRFMLDFKLGFKLKKSLMNLPADYKRYSIPE